MKNCKKCSKEFEPIKGLINYCSLKCRNSRIIKEEHKQNISKKLKEKWSKDKNENFLNHQFKRGNIPWSKGKKLTEETKLKIKKTKIKNLKTVDPNCDSILDLSSRTVRKIIKRLELGCSNCGWNEAYGDIHHINGRNFENCNNHDNLSYLCPNCHRLAHIGKLKKEDIKTLTTHIGNNWKNFYYKGGNPNI